MLTKLSIFSLFAAINSMILNTIVLQLPMADINELSVYSILTGALLTAVVVLWRDNQKMRKEIKSLNKTILEEIKKRKGIVD